MLLVLAPADVQYLFERLQEPDADVSDLKGVPYAKRNEAILKSMATQLRATKARPCQQRQGTYREPRSLCGPLSAPTHGPKEIK